jgi:hypothetical protein
MRDRPIELYRLPPDLDAWGWRMQQAKAGPRNRPPEWFQFIFWRRHGLAKGEEALDPQDPSLRVKVRRSTQQEAFAEAIREMRQRTAGLQKSDDYQRLMETERQMMEQFHAWVDARRGEARDESSDG